MARPLDARVNVATEWQVVQALHVVEATTRLIATFALLQGVFIILGHKERWASPAFATALSFPGAPESWGGVLIACGATALTGSLMRKCLVIQCGMVGIAIWCFFFMATFIKTAIENPTAGTTGIWAYGLLGAISCIMTLAYKRGK